MAVDMFSTRTMLGMIEASQKKATTFLRDRYFGNVVTFDTAKIDIDIVSDHDRKVAPFVNPKIGGSYVARDGYQTNSYEAPELSPMMVTTAEDMLKRSAGESMYSMKSPSQRASEEIGRNLSQLDDIITRREEVMCAEALFDGQITVNGEGYSDIIKYWSQLSAGEQPKTVLSTKWTASGADPMKDLRTIRRSVIQKCGITPTEVICGTGAIEALLDKVNGQQLDTRRVDLGMINPSLLPNGVTYWGYLKDSGLDIYSYDSWYVNASGVETAIVPSGSVLLGSPNVKTTMAYGCVSLTGDGEVRFYEGKRVPDSWVQRANPSGRVVQIKSRPLPIINQIQGFHVISAI